MIKPLTVSNTDAQYKIKYTVVHGQAWFKGKEVATICGYSQTNLTRALMAHVEEEDRRKLRDLKDRVEDGNKQIMSNSNTKFWSNTNTSEKNPEETSDTSATIFVNESGLYSLILRSDKPEAKAFKKWITSVVLPSIRKTGAYRQPEPEEETPPPPEGGTPLWGARIQPPKLALASFDKSKIAKNNQININSETDLHAQVVKWIRRYHQDHIMLAGLGEFQTTPSLRIEGYRKGYTKGTCDLMILNNHTRYKGMGIEFKTPKGDGKLSEPQAGFLSNLQLNGYYILVSNDYDEIIDELRNYLAGVRIICPHCKKKTMYYKSVAALDSHCAAFHGRGSTPGSSDLKRMRTE